MWNQLLQLKYLPLQVRSTESSSFHPESLYFQLLVQLPSAGHIDASQSKFKIPPLATPGLGPTLEIRINVN